MAATPEQVEQAKKLGITDPAKIEEWVQKMQNAKDATDSLGDSFSFLDDLINSAGVSLDKMGTLVGADAAKFGLLSNSILGATENFKGFLDVAKGGAIGTFGESMQGLINTVGKQGTVFAAAATGAKHLISILTGMGASGAAFQKAMSGSAAGLADFAKNFITGADNVLRFQNGIMDAMAAGGSFHDFLDGTQEGFSGIGRGLEGLNKETSKMQNIMGKAMIATGIESTDVMGNFMKVLMSSPDALGAMTKGLDIAGTHTDSLTGIIRLAHGANLDVMQAFQDVSKVEAQFGINTQNATELVMRQVDVMKGLKARQEDVHEAIFKTLNTYKMFTREGVDSNKMTQGLTDSVKNWAGALKSAGVPIQTALELGAKYTSQLKDMDEAQESFVNQQTGGSGGLLGALEFETLLTKDPAAAAAKATEAMKMEMKKQGFSQIISKEQAVQMGEAGARQYQLQRQLTQSGIFGVKAQSKEESDAMIGALAKGTDLGEAMSDAKKNEVLAQTMQTGAAKEQLAYTGVKEANITAEIVRMQGGTISLENMQNAFAARSGGMEATGRGIGAQQRLLQTRQEAGMAQAQGTGTDLAFKTVGNFIADSKKLVTAAVDSEKRQFTQSDTMNEMLKNAGFTGPVVTKDQAKTSDDAARQYAVQQQILMSGAMGKRAQTKEEADAMIVSMQKEGTGEIPTTPPGTAPDTKAIMNNVMRNQPALPPGRQVGQAIPTGTTTTTTTGTAAHGGTTGIGAAGAGGPVPVTLAPGSAITVNFTGTCLHCGRPIHQNEHTNINNAASGASNKGVR